MATAFLLLVDPVLLFNEALLEGGKLGVSLSWELDSDKAFNMS